MCGPKGPSAQEQIAQEKASRDRSQAEADKLKAEQDLEKQKAGEKALADQVAQANADQARRSKNRTLLAGLEAEEGLGLEDPSSKSEGKRRRATLLAAPGS